MATIDSVNNPLIEEAQLGVRLNHDIHNNSRSDFALLLSMLVDDVRVHSQFNFPATEQTSKDVTNESLRAEFQLPPKTPLGLTGLSQLSQFEQAELVEKELLATLHLNDAIKAKALAFRDDKSHIASEVMTNTTLYCQLKHRENQANVKKRSFDAPGWLKALQDTVVKSPLLDATV